MTTMRFYISVWIAIFSLDLVSVYLQNLWSVIQTTIHFAPIRSIEGKFRLFYSDSLQLISFFCSLIKNDLSLLLDNLIAVGSYGIMLDSFGPNTVGMFYLICLHPHSRCHWLILTSLLIVCMIAFSGNVCSQKCFYKLNGHGASCMFPLLHGLSCPFYVVGRQVLEEGSMWSNW